MSSCGVAEASPDLLARFERSLAERRVPIEGSFAITRRCNLRCEHCYLGERPEGSVPDPELSSEQAVRILDQLVEAGTLHLSLTGGEPLLHPGFAAIYRHAVSRGMLVTVMSNGVAVDDAVVELMREWPPRRVELTMHGATAPTFEAVTRIPGSHGRFLRGLERLLGAGIRVALKTVVMRVNVGELAAMESFARVRGLPFRYDSGIFPAFPLQGRERRPGLADLGRLRLDPEEAAALDAETPERRAPWLEALAEHDGPEMSRLLYRCGAGLTNFHVDEGGHLTPCLMVTGVKHDLSRGTFAEGWNGTIARFRELTAPEGYPCPGCEAEPFCAACPALADLEGTPDQPAAYHCRTARQRLSRMGSAILDDKEVSG